MKHEACIPIIALLIGMAMTTVVHAFPGEFIDSGQELGNTGSTGVALGDFDGDGDYDAFVAVRSDIAAGMNAVWLNDGAANFTFHDDCDGVISNSTGVALGDFDDDGIIDAYVTNNGAGGGVGEPDIVCIGNGNGTFRDSGQRLGDSSGNYQSNTPVVGDIDADGDLDVAVAHIGLPGARANLIWVNDGDGRFTQAQAMGEPSTRGIAIGDLDGDLDLDLFFGNDQFLVPNTVWFNDGNGHFIDSGQALGNSQTSGVSLGDLDGDGDLDAFVANFPGYFDRVWVNDGNGHFSDSGQTISTLETGTIFAALGDVDLDGDLDAVLAIYYGATQVWFNDGIGNFSDSGQRLISSRAVDVKLADLDSDGDLDAFIANDRQPDKVWLNQTVQQVNTRVTFDPDQATYSFTPDASGCPSGFVGKFGFAAQLANISQSTLTELQVRVAELSNGNLVLTDAGTTIGEGGSFPVPQKDDYADSYLAPSEHVDVPFTICLKSMQPFRLFVDVLGKL